MKLLRKEYFFRNIALDALHKVISDKSLSPQQALEIISTQQDLSLLIELAGTKLYIHQVCLNPVFDNYWNHLLANPIELKAKIKFASSRVKFLSQPLVHNFNLIAGIYYYYQALACKQKNEYRDFLDNLNLSETHGFFPAIDLLNKMDTDELYNIIAKKQFKPAIFIDSLISRAKRAAELHGTPGYLIWAYTTLSIAKYNKHILKDELATAAAYQLAITYLEAARLLENDCQASIHNAYFGGGIAVSNDKSCADIAHLRDGCIDLAGIYMDEKSIVIAKQHAEQLAENLRVKITDCESVGLEKDITNKFG